MKLSKYLISKSFTSEQFAKKMRVSISSVNKWRTGNRMPSFEMALRLRKATRGRVKLEDWHK